MLLLTAIGHKTPKKQTERIARYTEENKRAKLSTTSRGKMCGMDCRRYYSGVVGGLHYILHFRKKNLLFISFLNSHFWLFSFFIFSTCLSIFVAARLLCFLRTFSLFLLLLHFDPIVTKISAWGEKYILYFTAVKVSQCIEKALHLQCKWRSKIIRENFGIA